MLSLPPEMVAIVAAFAPLFSPSVFANAQTLVWGTLLARGPRTVTAALRAMGKHDERQWTNFHRVLNRAVWSGLAAGGTLLLLVLRFVPGAVVLVAIDDMLERRTGQHIRSRGVFRDPLTSSRAHLSKSSGLRWVVASVLVQVPWSTRAWALPVLSVLAPPPPFQTRKSKAAKAAKAAGVKYLPPLRKRPRAKRLVKSAKLSTASRARQGARRHKTTVDLAAQILSWLGRRAGGRRVVAIADGAYGAHKLLEGAARRGATVVTRLHWDAQLYDLAEPAEGGGSGAVRMGARGRSPRERAGALETVWRETEVGWYGGGRKRLYVTSFEAVWTKDHGRGVRVRVVLTLDPKSGTGTVRQECFVCTDVEQTPEQIVGWFALRWNEEVTFEEARRHLGIQTQRTWSAKAVGRTTPALLGLFSLVTLMADALAPGGTVPIRQAAWYDKTEATFSDCLALVRREILRARLASAPPKTRGAEPIDPDTIDAFLDALPLTA